MNVTIKAGETVSGIADLGDKSLVGLQIGNEPGLYLRFLASNDGQAWGDLRNDGTAPVNVLIHRNSVVWLDPIRFPARYLRLVLQDQDPNPDDVVIQLLTKGRN